MPHRIVLEIDAMDGPAERRTFDKPSVTVGRATENDIVVAARQRPGVHHGATTNCSRRHGILGEQPVLDHGFAASLCDAP